MLASVTDMATYVRMQLRRGVSTAGARVVSTQNLEECWRPHVTVPPSPLDGTEIESSCYGMGWIDYTYAGGHRLLWHTGFWDGFGTFIGFLPEEDIGLVIVTNVSASSSQDFHKYVLNLLLEDAFGLNRGMNEAIVTDYQKSVQALADTASRSTAVDASAVAPFLGYYERGYRLAFDPAGELRLHLSAAADRVRGMTDGSYVMASGRVAGAAIRFARDPAGVPEMTLGGYDESVRWLSGPS